MKRITSQRLLLLITLFVLVFIFPGGCGGGTSTPAGTGNNPGGAVTSNGAVAGTITDSTNGDEVEDANVTIGEQSTIANAVGNYEIQNVPAGRMSVTVTCNEYLPYSGPVNDRDKVCMGIINDIRQDESDRQTVLLHHGDFVRHDS